MIIRPETLVRWHRAGLAAIGVVASTGNRGGIACADPADEHGEFALGSATYSRRIAQEREKANRGMVGVKDRHPAWAETMARRVMPAGRGPTRAGSWVLRSATRASGAMTGRGRRTFREGTAVAGGVGERT